jgi:hypothetical protein
MSNGKKLLWASLLAAAAGAGVLFGHGLGNRVKQSGEERPDSLSRPQRTQDPQPVLDAPLTPSRKDNEKESNSDAGDGINHLTLALPVRKLISARAHQMAHIRMLPRKSRF